MVKINEITSCGEVEVTKKDFDNVSVIAEKDSNFNFKSYGYALAANFKSKLHSYLQERYKDFYYKIVVVTEEVGDVYAFDKIALFIGGIDLTDRVINSITELFNGYNLIIEECRDKPEPKKISTFEKKIQEYANELQRYLTNEKNFKGITKINASTFENRLFTFDIIVSGKGTTDEIVNASKELSKNVFLANKEISKEDYFTMILKAFEKVNSKMENDKWKI